MDIFYVTKKIVAAASFFITINRDYEVSVHRNYYDGKNFFIGTNLNNVKKIDEKLGQEAIMHAILKKDLTDKLPSELQKLCDEIWQIAGDLDPEFKVAMA